MTNEEKIKWVGKADTLGRGGLYYKGCLITTNKALMHMVSGQPSFMDGLGYDFVNQASTDRPSEFTGESVFEVLSELRSAGLNPDTIVGRKPVPYSNAEPDIKLTFSSGRVGVYNPDHLERLLSYPGAEFFLFTADCAEATWSGPVLGFTAQDVTGILAPKIHEDNK